MRPLRLQRSPTLVALASAILLAALATALIPSHPTALAVGLAAFGAGGALAQTLPGAARMVLRRPSLLLVLALFALLVAWVVVGVRTADRAWPPFISLPEGQPFPHTVVLFDEFNRYLPTSWPWRVGRLPLLPLLLAVVCAVGGFVLLADAVRVQTGVARPPRSLWRSFTVAPTRTGRIAVRAVPGVALIGVSAALGISLISRYVAGDPVLATLGMLGIGGCAALLVAGPVGVGVLLALDIDQAGRAREQERRRFAAHLHDSVLQTLALIQRQAADAETVAKLARRQEHALRAWMAGEASLSTATLAAAVREMVDEVEDDHGFKVELTAIGDSRIDDRSEELVAAAREALRNVARHAPGAPVNVFLDVGPTGAEMFIRDDGPGFDPNAVPAERRGLRDAVIGRMSLAGGSATVESRPGEGTEIALKLPVAGHSR